MTGKISNRSILSIIGDFVMRLKSKEIILNDDSVKITLAAREFDNLWECIVMESPVMVMNREDQLPLKLEPRTVYTQFKYMGITFNRGR